MYLILIKLLLLLLKMMHTPLQIKNPFVRALCDSENLVGLMGSTNRVTSSISVWLPTYLLQIFVILFNFFAVVE